MRVAVVHDWLTTYAGAEKVLEQILTIFPKSDLFAVVDFFPNELRPHLLGKKAKTTFIQNLPWAQKCYPTYLPLMPLAIEQFDFSPYDLVISSSHAVAKGVLTSPGQRHICYCHTPMRYAWDLRYQYVEGQNPLARYYLHKLRQWDVNSSNSVDRFIANSNFIAKRIEKYYRRRAEVIYPPVAIEKFPLQEHKSDYYVTAARLVGYKRVDLIVEAFRSMPGRRLVVIGTGPLEKKLKKKAPANVAFTGYLPHEKMADTLSKARAFVYAAIEDFGIVPVEAQATGTAVIAYGKGGVKESCEHTALFFNEQSAAAIREAVEHFELCLPISPLKCRHNAERFSETRFREEFLKQIAHTGNL